MFKVSFAGIASFVIFSDGRDVEVWSLSIRWQVWINFDMHLIFVPGERPARSVDFTLKIYCLIFKHILPGSQQAQGWIRWVWKHATQNNLTNLDRNLKYNPIKMISEEQEKETQKGWVHYLNLQFHRYKYYRHAYKGSYTVRRCEWSGQTEVQFDQADGKVMTELNLPETFRVVFSLSSVLNEPLLALQWYSPLFEWSIEAMVKLSLLAACISVPL